MKREKYTHAQFPLLTCHIKEDEKGKQRTYVMGEEKQQEKNEMGQNIYLQIEFPVENFPYIWIIYGKLRGWE